LRERLQVFFEKNIFLSRKNAISLPSETGDKIAEETPRLLASPKMNKQLIFTANNKRIMANLVNANAANAAQVVKGYAYNRSLVKNKMMVMLNWLWKYVSYNDSIRMITYATKPKEVRDRLKREQTTHLGTDLLENEEEEEEV
jgi:hypothetical protein